MLSWIKYKIVQFKWQGTIQGTLMQIWKSHYMLVIVQKEYHGNFAFLILRIFDLLPLKFENFLKIRRIFNIFFFV